MTGNFDFGPIEKAMKDRARQGLANRGATVRGVLSDVSAIYSEGDDETQIAATLTAHFADADMPISSETIEAFAAAISHGQPIRVQAPSPFHPRVVRSSTELKLVRPDRLRSFRDVIRAQERAVYA